MTIIGQYGIISTTQILAAIRTDRQEVIDDIDIDTDGIEMDESVAIFPIEFAKSPENSFVIFRSMVSECEYLIEYLMPIVMAPQKHYDDVITVKEVIDDYRKRTAHHNIERNL